MSEEKKEEPDEEYWDEEEDWGDRNCPCCGEEYDDIDFEYQICHRCKFQNNPRKIRA